MCGLGRQASIDTCTNCGLVLKVKPRAVAVRKTSGPEARRRGGGLTIDPTTRPGVPER